jgi:hypothetical protein
MLPPRLSPPRATPEAMIEPVNLDHGQRARGGVGRAVDVPEAIEDGRHHPTVCRVRDLHHIHGARGRRHVDPETQEETTAHELFGAIRLGGHPLDDGAHDDAEAPDPHAEPAAVGIGGGTDERQRHDAADLVHGGDDARPDAGILSVVVGQEGGVGQEVVDQRPIVAVHGGAEEADEARGVQLEGGPRERLRRLLEHGLVEGLVALDDPHLDFAVFLGHISNAPGMGSGAPTSSFCGECSWSSWSMPFSDMMDTRDRRHGG